MSQNFCTQCGAKLSEVGNFCPQCGAPVGQATPDAPASPPPATPPLPERPAAQLDAELAGLSGEASADSASSSRAPLYALGGVAVIVALFAVAYFAFLRAENGGLVSDCGGVPCTVEAVTADAQVEAELPYPEVERISVDDAHMRLADGSAIFLDVRDSDSYAAMHIPGALWIPLDEIEARQNELPRDAEILTYCT